MNAPKWWKIVPALLVAGAVGLAYAKLPPPSEEAKAKAAEAKAKADHGDKVGAYKLCLADRKSTRLNSSHIQKSRMPSSA